MVNREHLFTDKARQEDREKVVLVARVPLADVELPRLGLNQDTVRVGQELRDGDHDGWKKKA